MFSSYRSMLWLAIIMTVFFYVPFDVSGWSTDVYIRFARIYEWANMGFPWREHLMAGQNFPYGHEMHWTRPLDAIGYAFAWPFIPNSGLKKSLEFMSYYVPLLTLLVGVGGFFYAVRGYLTPKITFIAFWLFFWGIGYVWSQSVVGYYDHHVFHFTLLVWVLALVVRSFLREHNQTLLIVAGVLTALGTWITAEFFINSYLVLLPFLFYWLMDNRTLKPALIYSLSYTLALLLAMSFDHPIAGFWTLDFYRVSLFHVILGALNVVALGFLMGVFALWRTSMIRRLIYSILAGVLYVVMLFYFFTDFLITPMVDARLYYLWTSKVSEMEPGYKKIDVIAYAVMPIILALGALIYALWHRRHRNSPMWILCSIGVLFYAVMYLFHCRVGISVGAFFVLLAALYFNGVFFPREKGFKITFVFVLFYMLFVGSLLRSSSIFYRMQEIGINVYKAEYAKNQNITMPEWVKKIVQDDFNKKQKKENKNQNHDQKKNKNNSKNNAESSAESEEIYSGNFNCQVSKEALAVIEKDNKNGGVFVDIFQAPEVLWKTQKPILSGPYHTNIDGVMDIFYITFDRGDFKKSRDIIKRRNLTQLYIQNPMCLSYFFEDTKTQEMRKDLNDILYYRLASGKKVPTWLQLEYHNEETGERIYRVK